VAFEVYFVVFEEPRVQDQVVGDKLGSFSCQALAERVGWTLRGELVWVVQYVVLYAIYCNQLQLMIQMKTPAGLEYLEMSVLNKNDRSFSFFHVDAMTSKGKEDVTPDSPAFTLTTAYTHVYYQ